MYKHNIKPHAILNIKVELTIYIFYVFKHIVYIFFYIQYITIQSVVWIFNHFTFFFLPFYYSFTFYFTPFFYSIHKCVFGIVLIWYSLKHGTSFIPIGNGNFNTYVYDSESQ